MKKILIFITVIGFSFLLTACQENTVVCGEGTMIKDGQCVAITDNNTPDDPVVDDVNCDDFTGEIFYEADWNAIEPTLVDNEPGNVHSPTNFVVWGQSGDNTLLTQTSVENNELVIRNLEGDQLDTYYDSGLGYQFFDFETDRTYTVCAIVEGPIGEYMTSELGIFYGHGTKDDFELTGEAQMVVQTFKPTQTTNTDYGQYVLFLGKISGTVTIKEIKITVAD